METIAWVMAIYFIAGTSITFYYVYKKIDSLFTKDDIILLQAYRDKVSRYGDKIYGLESENENLSKRIIELEKERHKEYKHYGECNEYNDAIKKINDMNEALGVKKIKGVYNGEEYFKEQIESKKVSDYIDLLKKQVEFYEQRYHSALEESLKIHEELNKIKIDINLGKIKPIIDARKEKKQDTDKMYQLLRTYETPCMKIHAGVIKKESEWIDKISELKEGDCKIKTDWFAEYDN